MTIGRRFLRWTLYSMVFFASWMLVSGFYIAWITPSAPLWSWPLNLGVAALPVLLGAVIFGGVILGWSHLLRNSTPVLSAIVKLHSWFTEGTNRELGRRSAWIISVPIMAGMWLVSGLWAGNVIFNMIKTPMFAMLLFSGVGLITACGLVFFAPLWVLSIEGGVGLVMRPVQKVLGRNVFVPVYVLAVLVIVAGYSLVGLWFGFPHIFPVLPWHIVMGPLIGGGTVFLIGKITYGNWRRERWLLAFVSGLVVFLGFLSAYMPLSWQSARNLFVSQNSVASTWYGIVERQLDYDGDGAIHLYAGGDCAPYDASRGPHAIEIINNGIDEDCSGSDLKLEPNDYTTGTRRHPLPDGFNRRPNIVLITTDSLSYSYTSLGGYHLDTTPNLKAWAERATTFDNGFALSSATAQTLPMLMTGKYISFIGMKDDGRVDRQPYNLDTTTFAKLVKEQGYDTIFLPGHEYFSRKEWAGLSLGFDVLDTDAYQGKPGFHHSAPSVTERALHYLRSQDREKPLFLWLHYFDHHSPFITPDGHRVFPGTAQVDHFNNELHWADHHWNQVIREVESMWDPNEYIMIFTSDHGEDFGEEVKVLYHGDGLGTQSVHVQLIIQGPKQRGRRVQGLVSHADIPVTLMNLLEIEAPEYLVGESLVPVLFEGAEIEKSVLYGLFYQPAVARLGQDSFWDISVRTDKFVYLENLRTGTRELIDWKNDHHDRNDVSKLYPREFDAYRYFARKKLLWLREHEKGLKYLREDK